VSGQRTGATIGAVAGLVFVLVNAGALPAALAAAVRVAGVVAFVVAMVLVVRGTAGTGRVPHPPGRAWRVYWVAVGLEVLLLPLGSILLTRAGRPELGVTWVALVVGVHFLPFASAFEVPVFRTLGWGMVTLAVIGAVLVLTVGAAAGAFVAGVLSGAALLAFAIRYATPRE
jgi:hypothetical protein